MASMAARVLAGAHEVARGPAAEQETHGLDQDGFTRAGFAGEDVQARLELDLGRVDDREPLDAEEAKHAERARTSIVA